MFHEFYHSGGYLQQIDVYMNTTGIADKLKTAYMMLENEIERVKQEVVSDAEYEKMTDDLNLRIKAAQNEIASMQLSMEHNFHNVRALAGAKDISDSVRNQAQALIDERRDIEGERDTITEVQHALNEKRERAVCLWLNDYPMLLANYWVTLRNERVSVHKPYGLSYEVKAKGYPFEILTQREIGRISEKVNNGEYVFFAVLPEEDGDVRFVLVRRDCVYIPIGQVEIEDY